MTDGILLWNKQLKVYLQPRAELSPTLVDEVPPKLFKSEEPAYQDVHALRPPPQSRHAHQCSEFLRRNEINNFFDEISSTWHQSSISLKNTSSTRRYSKSKIPPLRPALEGSRVKLSLGTFARMKIPQYKVTPTTWSNHRIPTHQINNLLLLLDAIYHIDNTPPAANSPRPLGRQLGRNIHTWAHPVKKPTHDNCAPCQTNTATSVNNKSRTMPHSVDGQDPSDDPQQDKENTVAGTPPPSETPAPNSNTAGQWLQNAVSAGATLQELQRDLLRLQNEGKEGVVSTADGELLTEGGGGQQEREKSSNDGSDREEESRGSNSANTPSKGQEVKDDESPPSDDGNNT